MLSLLLEIESLEALSNQTREPIPETPRHNSENSFLIFCPRVNTLSTKICMKNWLNGHGSQEVLPSAVCKLETQERQWYNSVQVQRPKNLGADGVNPSPGQEKKR